MGHPAHRTEEVSDLGDQQPEDSVTGVGVPNVLLVTTCELQRGDVLGARYQIEAVIGTGGSGRVLRAFDRESRTPVALKILRSEFAADPVWAERFSRELRIGRSIIHPNVCRVFDIGDADGHKFLSMELASRGSIRGEVPKIGATRMTPTRPQRAWPDRVADAKAVVEGIAALHAAGIIHRDIKPENILRMEDGRLVVTDFGLATDPGANAGNTVMVGTPSYMAPEVVMGDPATARSDVWGVGVVLHEILFGCRPQWKAMGRGYRRFVLPHDLTTAAQRAAATLCGLCADDSAEVRPASAVEVSSELARALRGKRRITRPGRRSVAWGALALASFAILGLIRERWTNRAQASLSGAAAPVTERVLTPTGTPEDWSKGATKLASFAGRVHCFSLSSRRGTAQVVWGEPRQAEDVDFRTGRRTASGLLPITYESGCPEPSPDGSSILFDRSIDGAKKIFLAANSTGADAAELVRGGSPHWLSNGQEFSFILDSRHAAIFSIPTRELTVVADSSSDRQAVDAQMPDSVGKKLAVLYTTDSFGSLLVVHSLPGLEILSRLRVPQWARNPRFDHSGNVSFTAMAPNGHRQIVSADLGSGRLRNIADVPKVDIHSFLAVEDANIVVTRKLRFDLSREDGNNRLVPLTNDGHSVHGSLSKDGRLIIQRTLPDASEVLVLKNSDGTEETVSSGPHDLTPSFFSDGSAWLYVRIDSAEIMQCQVSTRHCSSIHADALLPAFPAADPSGTRIAYLTSLNASRVRVVTRSNEGPASEQIDLGPAVDCGPVWTSKNQLWVVTSVSGGAKVWAEIDVDARRRTGVTRAVRAADVRNECPFPGDLSSMGAMARVIPTVDELSDLTRTARRPFP